MVSGCLFGLQPCSVQADPWGMVQKTAPPPGWYPDPSGEPQNKWWDGEQWTEHLQRPASEVIGSDEEHPGASKSWRSIDWWPGVILLAAVLVVAAVGSYLGMSRGSQQPSASGLSTPTTTSFPGPGPNQGLHSNLTNAITEVQAQYKSTQDYSFAANGRTQATLNYAAPQFFWVDGNTASADENHMSTDVVAVASPGDNQGIVIAALDAGTGWCWYAMNLQGNAVTGLPPAGITVRRAGTYSAFEKASTFTPCEADNAINTGGFKWSVGIGDPNGGN